MAKRQLRLGAFMRPVSIHTGAWRYPGAWPDANFNFAHIKRLIQKLEAGKFDAFFMADHLAVLNMPVNALKRSHTVTSFEPFTLLSALAATTEHIGLIATGSTTFDEPYHVARRFASLDHISGGRAGWNIVTTSNPDAALNFGLDDHMEHAERYRRAREFYDVVTGLWDSFADDAFVRDVEQGLYFDPAKMHVLNHKGKYLSVRGPLNIGRPVQGWPVIVQAGASDDGRQLAAETAEAVFTGGGSLSDGQKLYADIKGRMDKLGRDRNDLKILPGAFVVVGDSVEEAREKRGLCYSIYSFHATYTDVGMFGLYAGTDAADASDLMRLIVDEIAKAAETITEAEIARAKAQMKAGLLMALESSGDRIGQLARHMLAWGRPIPLTELVAKVEAVTVESARAAGRALIGRGKPAIAVLGLGSGLENAAAIAETLTRRAA